MRVTGQALFTYTMHLAMDQETRSDSPSMEGIARPRRQVRRSEALQENSASTPADYFNIPQISHEHAKRLSLKGPAASKRWNIRNLFTPHPVRKLSLFIVGIIMLTTGFLGARVWWAAKHVIVKNNNGAAALADEVDPSQLKGEGDGRINALLIGVGGEGHQAGDLADSIILASIDPVSKSAVMVNIPRDLYVQIPGFGGNKINAAHAFGEQYKAVGQGPELLKQTVSTTLGLPIHYHMRVDFDAFKEAVNTVGGVEVDVPEAIYDYNYPDSNLQGYDSFTIEAGRHYLDGETALKYARSRESTSDFDRSRRQQLLLVALANKALGISTLTNPAKISSLISSVGNHLQTNVQLDEIKRFLELAKKIDTTKVRRINFNDDPENYLGASNRGGASVLTPRGGDFAQIKRYLRTVMPDGYIKRENATLRVVNATGQPGVAAGVADLLRVYGYNVVGIDTAQETASSSTVVVDATGGSKPYTINYLERRFGVKAERRESNQTNPADVTIVIGNDYQPKE